MLARKATSKRGSVAVVIGAGGVGHMAIQVLKAFMNLDYGYDQSKLMWLVGIRLVFVVSTLVLALSDRLGHHGGGGIALSTEEARQRKGGRDLGAVEKGKSLLGTKRHRLAPGALQGFGTGDTLALHHRRAFADEDETHMGQRRQIARGADRALAGNDGKHIGIEERGQGLHGGARNAGGALGQRVEFQEQDEPDGA